MSHGTSKEPVDVVRKTAIVVVLLAGLAMLHRFVGTPTAAVDPRGLLALGFVVLAAHAIGELAEVFKLPHITGYLLAGLVLGPSAAHELGSLLPAGLLPAPFDHGVLNSAVIGQLAVLDTLALPLICLTAGGELDLQQIRKGLRPILSVLGGQVVTMLIAFGLFTWAIGGAFPAIALPALEGVSGSGLLALSGLLASLGLATSAAATIAIIVGTGSKGQMTNTVLSVVVMKDVTVVVMFAAFMALAGSALGTGSGTSFGTSLLHIGQSVVIGAAVGGLIHLYLRFVKAELLLFLVSLIFTVSWVSHIVHAEIALVFITAGFVIGTFSDLGDPLIEEVERLSLPVYVVFFTLAGARLHLDVIVQMAGFAAALVALRTAAVWLGVRGGAVLGGADPQTRRFGWMGMISQAGLSISLAAQLPAAFPGALGDGLFALVLAGVAVHEVVGPALFQVGLSLAGETAERRAEQDQATAEDATTRADGDAVPSTAEGGHDPWAPAFASSSPALARAVEELQLDLVSAVDAWSVDVAQPACDEHRRWLQELRREFLRSLRRCTASLRSGSLDPELVGESFEAIERSWRSLALARAARPGTPAWTILGLVTTLDARVDSVAVAVEAPLEASSLAPRTENLLRRGSRWWLRQRARLGPVTRTVALRDLARFHVSGGAVGALEGLLAVGVRAELQLIDEVSDAYAVAASAFSHLSYQTAAKTLEPKDAETLLWAMRESVEEKLQLAREGLDQAQEDGRRRAANIVGAALGQVKQELAIAGTFELSYWRRRMGRAYALRNRGVKATTEGLHQAAGTLQARYHVLALELEVAALEVQVAQEMHGQQAMIARLMRDLGVRQVEVAIAGLAEVQEAFAALLTADHSPQDLAAGLRSQGGPAVRQLRECHRLVVRLGERLGGEVGVAAMRDALLAACAGLTKVYTVPAQPIGVGNWTLGGPTPTTQRNLRELAVAYVETNLTGSLEQVVAQHASRFQAAAVLLAEAEEVLSFNVDVAAAELEGLREATPTPEALTLVGEMLLGAVGRVHQRLVVRLETLEGTPDELHQGLLELVTAALLRLRLAATTGDGGDLRSLMVMEAVSRSRALQQVGLLRQPVSVLIARLTQRAADAVGPAATGRMQRWLGVRVDADDDSPFRRPLPAAAVPQVYERLFIRRELGGTGRPARGAESLERAARVISSPGLRSVAIVGNPGAGSNTFAEALWTRVGVTDPRVLRPESPVDVAQVDAWFADPGRPTTLLGLGHVFDLGPGGSAPLERLVEHLVLAGAQARWILCTEEPKWRTACHLAPIESAMATVVALAPLSAEELEDAMMARHRMSAYDIVFEPEGLVPNLSLALRPWSKTIEARRRRAWFQQLRAACAGHVGDASALWIASVARFEEDPGRLVMGPVPRSPIAALRQLPGADLILLRQVLRQGWIDPALHGAMFCVDPLVSRAELARLESIGLLERKGDRLASPRHLKRALALVLAERGWSP